MGVLAWSMTLHSSADLQNFPNAHHNSSEEVDQMDVNAVELETFAVCYNEESIWPTVLNSKTTIAKT